MSVRPRRLRPRQSVLVANYSLSHLSDGVLIALITTTTANVFGFFYVVVNYLFNKDKST